MTLLCVPIFVTDLESARRDMSEALAAGADIIELRIDKLADLAILPTLLNEKRGNIIVTDRIRDEGGHTDSDDKTRLLRLAEGPNQHAINFVDIELARLKKFPELVSNFDEKLIVSAHDFAGRPADLDGLMVTETSINAQGNKIVWKAENILDNLEAFRLIRQAKRPTIAFCMGESGLISRVLAKKFAAFLTFASLSIDAATAPGQVTIADIKRLYRWDAINPDTKVFGVAANPVAHSMSPAIHNAAFTATGYDGVYLPMRVSSDYASFKSFLDRFVSFPGMHLSGLSVTIPHKANALQYLREKGAKIDDLAGRIGAINTIKIESSGAMVGTNTDYPAILDSITASLGIGRDQLRDLRVGVLGAGGTGRAAVAALAHYGAHVLLTNRNHARAEELAREFGGKSAAVSAVSLADLCAARCDVLINTTSVGMYPNDAENPLGSHEPPFNDRTLVFDTIYNPMKTRLLQQAAQRGAKTISGVEMFIRQAAGQFKLWTNLEPPIEVMRQVIEQRLSANK
jgi:3-dehydroquinate dehydratase/shikimate dehydrogenase